MHGENNSVYQQQKMVSILSVFKKIDHFFKSSTLAKTDVSKSQFDDLSQFEQVKESTGPSVLREKLHTGLNSLT